MRINAAVTKQGIIESTDFLNRAAEMKIATTGEVRWKRMHRRRRG